MFHNYVCEFWIFYCGKITEKLVIVQGGHGIGINIHGCQPNLEIAIYELKSACGLLLCTRLYSSTR